jgi:hypothetical protein
MPETKSQLYDIELKRTEKKEEKKEDKKAGKKARGRIPFSMLTGNAQKRYRAQYTQKYEGRRRKKSPCSPRFNDSIIGEQT